MKCSEQAVPLWAVSCFSGSFDAASEDVLMRHQKVLRRGVERCALRPPAVRVRARAVRYRRGIAAGERGQALDDSTHQEVVLKTGFTGLTGL